MKNARLTILCSIIVVTASACATTQIAWKNVREDWNPPQGLDYARAQCEAKMNAFYPMNPFAIIPEKGRVYRSCMSAYGYEIDKK